MTYARYYAKTEKILFDTAITMILVGLDALKVYLKALACWSMSFSAAR